ncbi:MazG family protein [Deinococcus maricopensis]|uniref:MazG family protein n=1 Tax=Deinococcus maricopensis (strain DSM 21211 / LMG 22137 / NRRL B-23946 / LB-34) TaxID=709986 RepID=E8U7Y6_DEIML|nr:MazG family protein [Deinococcus maricopensis]ADV67175.1 MazG family protein [Deinococcus maricopensis DSM 21211]
MNRLLDTMRHLRAPDGCPWDREQTHESLRPYLLEEAAEAVDAITLGDDREIVGELGDVLLQVAFHATIAEEAGRWSYADVEGAIVQKLERRHPHVFGEVQVEDADEVVRNWQAIKAQEGGAVKRGNARVPSELGALAREVKAQKVLGQDKGTKDAVRSVVDGAADDEAGVAGVLAAVVAWARSCGVDPETALRARTARALEVDVERA